MNKMAAYIDETGCWLDIRFGDCPYCVATMPHRHRIGNIWEPLDPYDVEATYEGAKTAPRHREIPT